MRLLGFTTGVLLLASYSSISAAATDHNGYTAQYECRAGNPNCNVDVAALSQRGCDQIISPSTPWASINWSNNTICIEAGDHTAKGTLTIPSSAKGSSGNYKVLRYYRSGDTNNAPWLQSSTQQAKLHMLVLDGADYWMIDRLAFLKNARAAYRVRFQNGSSDVIFNRLLVEGEDSMLNDGGIVAYSCSSGTGDRMTIQNSVVRNNAGKVGSDAIGVGVECGTNFHVVNNELYDYSSHAIQMGYNGGPTLPGLVIENNDIYVTPAMHTPDGTRMYAENPLTVKAGGSQSNPVRVIKNRIWGARFTDTNNCCIGGGPGSAMSNTPPTSSGFHYMLWQNNVVMDSQQGLTWPVGDNSHQSVIGNIFYKIRRYYSGWGSHAIEFINQRNTEVYLNTIVNAGAYYMYLGDDSFDNDIRCNAVLGTSTREGNSPNSGTVMDNNAFYGTSKFTYGGSDRNISHSLRQRAGGTYYNVGDVILTGDGDSCSSTSDSKCYMYKVVNAGTTSGGSVGYCTGLGCTTTDGSVRVQAVRGPYSFYRKLLTNPEVYIIPYARVHTSASEAQACPSSFSARSNIGVNDEQ